MGRLTATALFCAVFAFADEPADRAAIETVIHSLRTAEPSALFTANADSDLNRLKAIEAQRMNALKEPWSEKSPPLLVIDSVRFLDADTATVNAAEMQLGGFPVKIPVLFVMKRESSGWKIAVLKILASGVV